MNEVRAVGNLATDVDVRALGDDRRVASFLLAIDRPGEGKGADFVRVSAWNQQADACARLLAKGRRVSVEGRLRSRSWEDPDGKRRSAVEVVANSVRPIERAEAPDEMPFVEARSG